jgi:hypothetical protein
MSEGFQFSQGFQFTSVVTETPPNVPCFCFGFGGQFFTVFSKSSSDVFSLSGISYVPRQNIGLNNLNYAGEYRVQGFQNSNLQNSSSNLSYTLCCRNLSFFFKDKPSTQLFRQFIFPLIPTLACLKELAVVLTKDSLFRFSGEEGKPLTHSLEYLMRSNMGHHQYLSTFSEGFYLIRHLLAIVCSYDGNVSFFDKSSKIRLEIIDLLLNDSVRTSSTSSSANFSLDDEITCDVRPPKPSMPLTFQQQRQQARQVGAAQSQQNQEKESEKGINVLSPNSEVCSPPPISSPENHAVSIHAPSSSRPSSSFSNSRSQGTITPSVQPPSSSPPPSELCDIVMNMLMRGDIQSAFSNALKHPGLITEAVLLSLQLDAPSLTKAVKQVFFSFLFFFFFFLCPLALAGRGTLPSSYGTLGGVAPGGRKIQRG